MTTTIKDLKTRLLAAVQPGIEVSGFKLQKSKDRFVKRLDYGAWWFVLDFTVFENLHAKPAIGVRIDAVEDIFHRTSGFEPKYQLDTPTLSFSLQGLVNDPARFEYVARSVSDLPDVAEHILDDFTGVALPYFEQHATLRQIDATLNQNPEEDCVEYPMDYLRCAHGLIVAKLVERQNFAELVESYRKKMRLFSGGFYLPKYEALVVDLSH